MQYTNLFFFPFHRFCCFRFSVFLFILSPRPSPPPRSLSSHHIHQRLRNPSPIRLVSSFQNRIYVPRGGFPGQLNSCQLEAREESSVALWRLGLSVLPILLHDPDLLERLPGRNMKEKRFFCVCVFFVSCFGIEVVMVVVVVEKE
ncbi:hypothetical protein E2C01_096583 [Portunus trituberculatus]|uniref:Uncharacterized protein n=1 Tax=Portunus trituberculatus TaxID=210409 RepID=A0A5B7JW04_PORTR|nr:hypothetical protein [Portunus trituberculatus]